MRVAGICLLVSSGCAQVLGLDTPALSGAGKDAGSSGDATDGAGPDDGALTRCKGDNFDDDSIDVSKWFAFQEATTNVVEKGQTLELYIDNTSGSAYCGVDAVNPLLDGETGVQLEIVEPSPNSATELALVLRVTAANQLIFGKDDKYLTATVRTSATNVSHTIDWSTTQHRFLRIERGSGFDNTITFSTSANGAMWTQVWQQQASFAHQSLTPEIYAGHYMQVTVATARVDNFAILDGDCAP